MSYINDKTRQITETRPAVPTRVGDNFNFNNSPENCEAWWKEQGIRIAAAEDVAQAEAKALADAIAAEEARQIAEQQAYIADLEANAKFYALQNAYLLLCEALTGERIKIAGEVQAAIVQRMKIADPKQGDAMESAFSFLSQAMNYYSNKWWDVVKYRDIPELVKAAQDLIALKG